MLDKFHLKMENAEKEKEKGTFCCESLFRLEQMNEKKCHD